MIELRLKSDLLRWQAYAHVLGSSAEESDVTLVETHISSVFLVGEHVFKLKKAVNFGFLDFSTLPKRLAACEAELLLNRRLATGVYLDVVPVTRNDAGQCELAGAGVTIDYAVHMKRLPDACRADTLLKSGRLAGAQIDAVALRLVEFHASVPDRPEQRHFGSPEAVLGNVEENFVQSRAAVSRYLEADQADELERFQRGFLRERTELFERRMRNGRVRDGHGDLRLEHVYLLSEGVAIIDCIEFNERFRYADVCADVAFLSMDLAEHGRVDLAERLLARYALWSEDFELYALVDFYQSYRAHVRAKVAGFVALSADVDEPVRERSDAEARRHYLLALSAARRAIQRSCLLLVCGVIASGKSSIAEALAGELCIPLLVADRIRKFLAGVSPHTPLSDASFADHYSAEATRAVYAELLQRAETVLGSGRSAILDASFRNREQREAARALAQRLGVEFLVIECRCERELCLARLAERARGPSVSDGRAAVFDEFAASFEAIQELPPAQHLVVDTASSIPENVRRIREALPV